MKKKELAANISKEIDAYLNGVESTINMENQEYDQLLKLGKVLADKDFSQSSNEKEVFYKILNKKNYNGGKNTMKKWGLTKSPVTKVAAFTLLCIFGLGAIQTSSAQEMVSKILKSISIGHVQVYEEEPGEDGILSEADLKGKYFDKDGNPIEEFTLDGSQQLYSADGTVVIGWGGDREENNLIVKDSTKLNNYTCFNVTLPTYLPEGFAFNKAEFYKDEQGKVENTKYIGLYFAHQKTGEYIYMQQRLADEETGYEAGGFDIKAVSVNGAAGVMYSDRNLDWEADGVIYALSGRGVVTSDELLKIAESI